MSLLDFILDHKQGRDPEFVAVAVRYMSMLRTSPNPSYREVARKSGVGESRVYRILKIVSQVITSEALFEAESEAKAKRQSCSKAKKSEAKRSKSEAESEAESEARLAPKKRVDKVAPDDPLKGLEDQTEMVYQKFKDALSAWPHNKGLSLDKNQQVEVLRTLCRRYHRKTGEDKRAPIDTLRAVYLICEFVEQDNFWGGKGQIQSLAKLLDRNEKTDADYHFDTLLRKAKAIKRTNAAK